MARQKGKPKKQQQPPQPQPNGAPSHDGSQNSHSDDDLDPIQRAEVENNAFEVEKILAKRVNPQTGKPEYLLKWKHFGPRYNSWEPPECLDCEEMVAEFEREWAERKRQEAAMRAQKKALAKLKNAEGSKTSNTTTTLPQPADKHPTVPPAVHKPAVHKPAVPHPTTASNPSPKSAAPIPGLENPVDMADLAAYNMVISLANPENLQNLGRLGPSSNVPATIRVFQKPKSTPTALLDSLHDAKKHPFREDKPTISKDLISTSSIAPDQDVIILDDSTSFLPTAAVNYQQVVESNKSRIAEKEDDDEFSLEDDTLSEKPGRPRKKKKVSNAEDASSIRYPKRERKLTMESSIYKDLAEESSKRRNRKNGKKASLPDHALAILNKKSEFIVHSPPKSLVFPEVTWLPQFEQTDRWRPLFGDEPLPYVLRVVNEFDDTGPPDDFRFISKCIMGEGVPVMGDEFLVGCKCSTEENGGCHSHSEGCACAEHCGGLTPYDEEGRVVLPPTSLIAECNASCSCHPDTCKARVIQKGSKCKFLLFRTANGRGWGVRTISFIPKGTFVMDYVGEVVTDAEAERRGKVYDKIGRTYLFDLDYFYNMNPSEEQGDLFVIDAFGVGNISHFFNHSCDPNLETYPFLGSNPDERLYEIALFAGRDIYPGEELCFDYSPTHGQGIPKMVDGEAANYKFIECLCGSRNCRKLLML